MFQALLEAQEMAVKNHNVEYKSNLYVGECRLKQSLLSTLIYLLLFPHDIVSLIELGVTFYLKLRPYTLFSSALLML